MNRCTVAVENHCANSASRLSITRDYNSQASICNFTQVIQQDRVALSSAFAVAHHRLGICRPRKQVSLTAVAASAMAFAAVASKAGGISHAAVVTVLALVVVSTLSVGADARRFRPGNDHYHHHHSPPAPPGYNEPTTSPSPVLGDGPAGAPADFPFAPESFYEGPAYAPDSSSEGPGYALGSFSEGPGYTANSPNPLDVPAPYSSGVGY
uniref:Transmembrane protein n=2 Tax=Physcomitrium patens TaxID=3218 RepID=A0A2K1L201_PHYPA|nr:hypothetical protein PHYPA_002841 [Physcomitrium patens]